LERFINCNFCFIDAADKIITETMKTAMLLHLLVSLAETLPRTKKYYEEVLTTQTKYACFSGMWYDEQNKYAYLEPLATVPKYRGLGLAKQR